MTYTEIQQALKPYREKGLTTIKLNSAKVDLEAELLRLESAPLTNAVSEEVGKFSQVEESVTPHQSPVTEPKLNFKIEKSKILVLAVEKKWFDMIAAGEKLEEYRKIAPYFEVRFNKPIEFIKFTNGYGSKVPAVTVELLGIEKGVPKPEWSEGAFDGGTEVFVLKLGKIVDANFELKQPKPVNWVRTYQDDLQGSYRIDESEEDEDGELWLERLEDGEPTENYVSVNAAQLEQLKANGQIWEYSRKVERWVPPGFDESEPITAEEQEYLDELAEAEDLADCVDDFLAAVTQKQLSEEQLEAIAVGMIVADANNITLSEALTRTQKFSLFTPNQLLSWGFDELIPRIGLFHQFRDAINAASASNVEIPQQKLVELGMAS